MAKNKTIAFFNGVYLPHLGGVERYTFELANRLKEDYNVVVITSNTDNLESVKDEDGVKVFRLPIKKLPKKNKMPLLKHNSEYKALLSEIKSLNIDHVIINTRFYETTFLGLKLAKSRKITPWIIDHSGGFVLEPYEKALIKEIKKYHPKFYSVSETNQKFLRTNLNIISNGVFYNSIDEMEDFKKPKNEKIKIVFAGRVMREKGVSVLAAAFEKIKKDYDVELEIIGDGPLLKTLKGKYKGIKFPGKLSNEKVLERIEKADIFVLPSISPEGFPTVLLEAGMKKCAIVTTKFPAMEELVGDSGILVDRKGELLEEALRNLLKDPEKIKELGEKIRKRVIEKFTWKETVNKVKKELKK